MSHRTFKQLAVLLFAVVNCCLVRAQRAPAGEWVPVGAGEVCEDQCDEPRPCLGDCLRRKLQLHCVYARRAFCCRYISLPYTQPNSTMYYSPAGAAGFGNPGFPGNGPMSPYPYGYGYSNPGYGPQAGYAGMGSFPVR